LVLFDQLTSQQLLQLNPCQVHCIMNITTTYYITCNSISSFLTLFKYQSHCFRGDNSQVHLHCDKIILFSTVDSGYFIIFQLTCPTSSAYGSCYKNSWLMLWTKI